MAAGRSARLRRLERRRDAIRAVGLRATRPRIAVLDVLERGRRPMTHAEVAGRLAREYDRATLYRNLVDLVEAGLARRSDLGDHSWRFEAVGARRPSTREIHPHFVCDGCGVVRCLPSGSVRVRAVPGAPLALRRGGVEVRVSGLCDDCR